MNTSCDKMTYIHCMNKFCKKAMGSLIFFLISSKKKNNSRLQKMFKLCKQLIVTMSPFCLFFRIRYMKTVPFH